MFLLCVAMFCYALLCFCYAFVMFLLCFAMFSGRAKRRSLFIALARAAERRANLTGLTAKYKDKYGFGSSLTGAFGLKKGLIGNSSALCTGMSHCPFEKG